MANTQQIYYLYTDSQSAEHLATQPNMTDNSRSIDIRHHEIKQDYLQDGMRVGRGVHKGEYSRHPHQSPTTTTTRKTLFPPTYPLQPHHGQYNHNQCHVRKNQGQERKDFLGLPTHLTWTHALSHPRDHTEQLPIFEDAAT
jgi:hypothetical protein